MSAIVKVQTSIRDATIFVEAVRRVEKALSTSLNLVVHEDVGSVELPQYYRPLRFVFKTGECEVDAYSTNRNQKEFNRLRAEYNAVALQRQAIRMGHTVQMGVYDEETQQIAMTVSLPEEMVYES